MRRKRAALIENEPRVNALIERARAGDEKALAELFEGHRSRLRQMVDIRLDRRLRTRVDASDVLQEAYVNLARKLESYRRNEDLPFFLWLRLVTGECIIDLHRRHLQAGKRNAALEVSLHQGPMPVTDSYSLAAQLLGKNSTASEKLMRAEAQVELQEALDSMEAIDREVIVLRSLEQLSNTEAAQVLDVDPQVVSTRYYRALRRLKEILER